jgi:hypothetical protein
MHLDRAIVRSCLKQKDVISILVRRNRVNLSRRQNHNMLALLLDRWQSQGNKKGSDYPYENTWFSNPGDRRH